MVPSHQEIDAKKQDDLAFARIILDMGAVSKERVAECLRIQAELLKSGKFMRLGNILMQKGYLSPEKASRVMRVQSGEIVFCKGCGASMNARGLAPGKQARCPQCKMPFVVSSMSDSSGDEATIVGESEAPVSPAALPGGPPARVAPPTPPSRRGPRAPSSQTADGRAFGRYLIVEEIAHGGMGVVYKARQTDLDRIVALKVLIAAECASDDEVKRFYREAQAASRLHHPNIVPILDMGIHEGQHYFTMEYVEGPSLSSILQKEPMLSSRRALKIVRDIASALDVAHRNDIVHRDIKPGNILIDKDGRARLTDFGLAKARSWGAELTKSGTAVGTPAYMSPEQASGELDKVDGRSDVYALGAVLYHMLTGAKPFEGDTSVQVMYRVINEDPVPPRQLLGRIPREVERICLKALEKEPEHRYQSAAAMIRDLDRYFQRQPVEARPDGLVRRSARGLRRNKPLLIGAIASGAVCLLIGIVVALALKSGGKKASDEKPTPDPGAHEKERDDAKEKEMALLREEMSLLRKMLEEQHKEKAEIDGKADDESSKPPDASGGGDSTSGSELSPDDITRALSQCPTDAGTAAKLSEQDFRAWIEAISKEIEKAPKDPILYWRRGHGYHSRNMHDHAVANFSMILELIPADSPARPNILHHRALSQFLLGRYEEAIADTTAVLELLPRNKVILILRGNAYLSKGDPRRAISDYDAVLEMEPKNLQCLTNRGSAYTRLGEYDKALRDLEEAVRIQPTDQYAVPALKRLREIMEQQRSSQ